MSEIPEIPDDIRVAAAEAHAAFATSSDRRNLGDIIALAILAERERGAKIAEKEAERQNDGSGFGSQPVFASALRIAATIRGRRHE